MPVCSANRRSSENRRTSPGGGSTASNHFQIHALRYQKFAFATFFIGIAVKSSIGNASSLFGPGSPRPRSSHVIVKSPCIGTSIMLASV